MVGKPLSCKNICERLKVKGLQTNQRYVIGLKRCNYCNVFYKWEGLFCPCCGYRLRSKPRTKSGKQNLSRLQSDP